MRLNRRIKSLLAVIVVFVLGVSVIVLSVQRMNKIKSGDYLAAQGVISRIETIYGTSRDDSDEHHVYVVYTVNGMKYEAELDSYSSKMYEGMSVDILYNKNDPTDIMTPGNSNSVVGFIGGGICILAGIVLIFRFIRGR